MRVIGITGGIASGKSAVEALLGGFPVIDADKVSREVVEPGQPGLAGIQARFGDEYLIDGKLNRQKMRQLIAKDQTAQEELNAILHPLIAARIQEKLTALKEEPVAFVSAALMLETGSYKRYDAVILVSAPLEIRLKRLVQRDGMSRDLARALIEKQWTDAQKRPYATVEIVNDGDLVDLKKRTEAALNQLGIPWRQAL